MATIWERVGGMFKRRPTSAPKSARPQAAPSTAAPFKSAPSASKPSKSAPVAPQTVSVHPTPAPRGKHLEYAPKLDGQADPGEIVWTWVTFEEDATKGKDRPVLVVGRDDRMLLGLMLSSEAKRDGQHNWYALGAGDWDGDHRPSWLRLDRVLEVHEDSIRREGAILDRDRFDAIAKTLRTSYGWH